jgi:hypothetical protein
MPIYMDESPLNLNFKLIGAGKANGPGFSVPLLRPEVQGFEAMADPTQNDIDAVAAALDGLYAELPAGQAAILAQIVNQASQATY